MHALDAMLIYVRTNCTHRVCENNTQGQQTCTIPHTHTRLNTHTLMYNSYIPFVHTVWLNILAWNIFWQIGSFESNLKRYSDVIIIV